MNLLLPEKKSTGLPFRYVSFSIGLSLLPVILYFAGSSFSFYHVGSADILVDSSLVRSKFVYLAISVFSLSVAGFSIFLSSLEYRDRKQQFFIVFAAAVFTSCLFDLVHLLGVLKIFDPSKSANVPFYWLIGRVSHLLILLAGSLICLKLPEESETPTDQKRLLTVLFTLLILALIGMGVYFLSGQPLPSVASYSFIPRRPDLVVMVGYLVLLAFLLPKIFNKYPSPFTHSVFLSIIPLIAMEAHIAFGSEQPLDEHFFIANFLKAVSVVLPLLGLTYTALTDKIKTVEKDRTSSYLKLMNDVSAASGKSETFNQAVASVIKVLADSAGFDSGHYYNYVKDERLLKSSSFWYIKKTGTTKTFEQKYTKQDLRPGEGVAGLALQERKEVWINGFFPAEQFPRFQFFRDTGIQSAFAFPILSDEGVIGVVELFSKKSKVEDVHLTQLARQIGLQLGRVYEREQASLLVKEQQVQLKTAQEMAQIGSWSWIPESDEMTWSDELFHIREFKPQSFTPRLDDFLSKVKEEDQVQVREVLNETAVTGKAQNFYYRIITAQGETKYVYAHCEADKDENGVIVRLFGTSQDITDRVITEKKFETLFQAAPDAIIVMDENGVVTGWNGRSTEIFGFEVKETVGNRLSELIIPERYRTAHEIGLRRFLSSGEARVLNREIEIQGVTKTGDEIPVSLKISRYKEGDKNVFVGFLRDISDRKKSEALLKSIMDSSLQAIMAFGFNPEAKTLEKSLILELANPYAKELFSSGNFFFLEGKPLAEIFHEKDLADLLPKFQSVLDKKFSETFTFHSEFLGKWFEMQMVALAAGIAVTAEDVTEQRHMQQRFEENKHLLQQITDSVPNILAVIDIKNNRPVYSNKEFMNILGYSEQEIKDMGPDFLKKLINPSDFSNVEEGIRTVSMASDNDTLERDFKLITKDGQERVMYSRSKVFKRDSDGSVRMILTIAEDITEKFRAEVKLYETNKKFEAVFNQTFQLMALIGIDGEIEQINDTALDFGGLEKDEVVGKKFWEVPWWPHPENYSTKLEDAVNRAVKGEFVQTQLMLGDEKTPTFIDLGVKPILDADGKFMFIIAEGRDISNEKRAIEKIARSERLYSAMARNMPDSAVVLLDKNLKVQLVEGLIWSDEQFSSSQLLGADLQSVLPGELYEKFAHLYAEAFEDRSSDFETEFEERFFKVNIVPVKNNDEQIFACLSVFHDITAIKKYQKELEFRIDELNRSNKDLEQFAYVASHDLQEPLRKIRAFGDRLISKYRHVLEGDGIVYIDRMENAATRMQKMIDDLLTFSRVSRPKESFVKTDLNSVVKEVIGDLEIVIEKKAAKVVIANELPVIYAISTQMRQLFQNLIGNALKFTRENVSPEVVISCKPVKEKEMNGIMVVTPNTKYYEFRVADNGIGFDEKYKDRIFTLFQRLHSRAEYEGTGIGLSVCKKIVEFHNGAITVKSTPGEGSTFIFYLPQNQKKQDENGNQ